tara:strand:- start:572 stop:1030 length:459 start_codon:yes stop_codon:yes gene_type:complete
MIKKILIFIIASNFLVSCDYKPIYSNQNKTNFKVIFSEMVGDKNLNKLITENIKRNTKKDSNEIIYIKINTSYSKDVLAKNTVGSITDYQAKAIATFQIKKNKNFEKLIINEKFNYQKITDSYEEKSYEQTIKKNLASSISQKLVIRLSIVE